MSTYFILIYIGVIITILLGATGIILLIYGLANKKNNMIIPGIILSFVTILIITYGALWGARKFTRIAIDTKKDIHKLYISVEKQRIELSCPQLTFSDSTAAFNDSGKAFVYVCKHQGCCRQMKYCDTTKCKRKCRNNQ